MPDHHSDIFIMDPTPSILVASTSASDENNIRNQYLPLAYYTLLCTIAVFAE